MNISKNLKSNPSRAQSIAQQESKSNRNTEASIEKVEEEVSVKDTPNDLIDEWRKLIFYEWTPRVKERLLSGKYTARDATKVITLITKGPIPSAIREEVWLIALGIINPSPLSDEEARENYVNKMVNDFLESIKDFQLLLRIHQLLCDNFRMLHKLSINISREDTEELETIQSTIRHSFNKKYPKNHPIHNEQFNRMCVRYALYSSNIKLTNEECCWVCSYIIKICSCRLHRDMKEYFADDHELELKVNYVLHSLSTLEPELMINIDVRNVMQMISLFNLGLSAASVTAVLLKLQKSIYLCSFGKTDNYLEQDIQLFMKTSRVFFSSKMGFASSEAKLEFFTVLVSKFYHQILLSPIKNDDNGFNLLAYGWDLLVLFDYGALVKLTLSFMRTGLEEGVIGMNFSSDEHFLSCVNNILSNDKWSPQCINMMFANPKTKAISCDMIHCLNQHKKLQFKGTEKSLIDLTQIDFGEIIPSDQPVSKQESKPRVKHIDRLDSVPPKLRYIFQSKKFVPTKSEVRLNEASSKIQSIQHIEEVSSARVQVPLTQSSSFSDLSNLKLDYPFKIMITANLNRVLFTMRKEEVEGIFSMEIEKRNDQLMTFTNVCLKKVIVSAPTPRNPIFLQEMFFIGDSSIHIKIGLYFPIANSENLEINEFIEKMTPSNCLGSLNSRFNQLFQKNDCLRLADTNLRIVVYNITE